MTAEFFAEGGNLLSITVTPGDKGVLKVYVDGEKMFLYILVLKMKRIKILKINVCR